MTERMRHRSLAAGVLALLAFGSLTACGDDSSTAEGSGTATSSVVPATSTARGTAEPNSDNGDANVMDGGITEVTELPPASAVRNESDDAFLAELRDKGIDVTDQLMQDQVIAAGHEQCQANSEGHDSFSVPAVAGQLQALGVTDKDPEATAAAIKAAAESHYCN